jgi:hypothetical protein
MEIKKIILLFLSVIILGIMYSFQLPDSIDKSKIPELVRMKLDQEVNEYYAERIRACKLDALVRAEDYVDSIIVNKINVSLLNNVSFPSKPARPVSPTSINLDDTTKVAPFLK